MAGAVPCLAMAALGAFGWVGGKLGSNTLWPSAITLMSPTDLFGFGGGGGAGGGSGGAGEEGVTPNTAFIISGVGGFPVPFIAFLLRLAYTY